MIEDSDWRRWEDALYPEDDWQGTSRPGNPPLYQTSNFVFRSVQDMQEALRREDEVPFYTRGTNPTLTSAAQKLADLEGMESGLLFASGSAAISAAVLSQVQSGDEIISITSPYSWTRKLFEEFCGKFGVATAFCDPEDLEASLTDRTRVIFLESPNSWTFETVDLASVTKVARSRGVVTILDNSYSTPLTQQAAAFGIDLVAHSATKYLSGHSDIVAGVLCGSQELIQKAFNGPFMTLGGVLSPFDGWLLTRSLRTLPLRLRAIKETTQEVVEFLRQHPQVQAVLYPIAESAENQPPVPQTGLLSVDVNTTDMEAVKRCCNALRRFKLGPSWGSYESLAFPAIATMGSMNYESPNIVINRIRLSIGLESPDTLINDLRQALDQL